MSVFVKVGMMYLVVGNPASNCGIGSVAVAVELDTFPFAVLTFILFAVFFPFGHMVCLVLITCELHLSPQYLFSLVVGYFLLCLIHKFFWWDYSLT